MTAPEPYRPSNGDEATDFMARWCDLCTRDRSHQDDPDHASGCPILAATIIYDLDDEEYPKEWIEGRGGPECTAYQPADDAVSAWATIPDCYQMELPL